MLYLQKKIYISVAILLCMLIMPSGLFSQTYKLRGKVMDGQTKETLVGVLLSLTENRSKGAVSDEKGEYVLNLPKGKHQLQVEYLGYTVQIVDVDMEKDMRWDIELQQSAVGLEEFVMSSEQADRNVASPQTGMEKMEIPKINKLPVLLGERDIIKTIQLTPGVQGAGEGSSGFHVRGGTADQNLILLDDIPLYNASHLMGFFSTFNSDVLQDVTLYKGSMPAQYGERLSSVLDVQQRKGDDQRHRVSGGIGLISSKLNIEGPIQKGKSSFLVGARRTYADAVARMSGVEDAQNVSLYFYDLNAKADFSLSEKDQLTFSGYLGKDKMAIRDAAETNWGNMFGALKWNRIISDRWSSKTSLFYNQYDYYFGMEVGMEMSGKSNIRDYGFKQDFIFQPSRNNLWKFGLSSIYHGIAPGNYEINSEQKNAIDLHHRYSLENGVYASNELKLTDRLDLIYGLRLSAFMALGEGEYYNLDGNNNITDSVWHKSGDIVKTYVNLEPRISLAYKLNDISSVKSAYARNAQNMHLLTRSSQGTPFDRWTSSSNNIKPQIADQFSVGYFRNFFDNTYEFSVEAYYKNMQNQIDYKDNADFNGYDVIETELLYGKGRAYGLELMLKKRIGRFTGWLGYTLSKSEKKIDGINENRWYNAYQDRTHDVSVVGVYELTPKWTLSAAWVYYTGNAITYPSGKYQINGKDVMYYAERNGYRMPAYHRFDLGATCLLKKTANYESELAFSLYNAYGRENAYMIQFRTNDNDSNKTTAYQYSLFKFVPSVSWNFKF